MKSRPVATCNSPEHYTPMPYIEGGWYVFDGKPDLDPASSIAANRHVRARKFFSELGERRGWPGQTVWLNPPGDKRGKLVMDFWLRANAHALAGGSVIWAGYNINTLPRLERGDILPSGAPCPGPMCWPTVIIGPQAPCTTAGGRIMWIDGKTGKPGKQPGHGNYFTLLSDNPAHRARFRERFGAWGSFSPGTGIPIATRILAALPSLLNVPTPKRDVCARVPHRRADVLAEINRMIVAGQLELTSRGIRRAA